MKIYYLNSNKLKDAQIDDIYRNAEPYRKLKYNTSKNDTAKRECMATDALIKLAVKDRIPSLIESPRTEHLDTGKLAFSNVDLDISVTHTSGHVFLALSEQCIGIDAELIREIDFDALNKRYFKYRNVNIASSIDFFREWTRLESGFKVSNEAFLDFTKAYDDFPSITTQHNNLIVTVSGTELHESEDDIIIHEFIAEEI